MTALDSAKEYTVCYKKMLDRKPYFPESEETVEYTYSFQPVEAGSPIKLYHVSDSHGKVDEAIAAARAAFGEETDLLVLNGDISDHSSSVENISMIYRIASGITGGTRPCVYSRGNHDMRGAFAEHLADHKNLSTIIEHDLLEEPGLHRSLLGDNLSGRKDHIAENGYKYLELADIS